MNATTPDDASSDDARGRPPEAGAVDVVVAGAGLNGLAAALLLADVGARVAVVDPTPAERLAAPDYDWRTTAVAQGGMRLLARVGAWDEAWRGGDIRDIRIVDADSPLFLHYDGAALDEGVLGCIVPNAPLRRRLYAAALAAPRIDLRLGVAVAAFAARPDRIDVTLTDGGRLAARLLVGADGRGSPVREKAGIAMRARDYRQTSIVATAAHARPHRGVAHERFLPGGPFAILPLPDVEDDDAPWPHRSSIVWTEGTPLAERMLRLERPAFDQELAARFGDQFGAVRSVGPIGAYPLKLVLSERMTAPRIALVGDAARAIHPIAGQGFNLGLRDSAELAEQAGARLALGLDPGAPDVLAAYAARRLVDVGGMIAATDGMNRLFSNEIWPLRHGRRLGLAAVQALPPLKRRFMRHAMGLAGRSAALAGDDPV